MELSIAANLRPPDPVPTPGSQPPPPSTASSPAYHSGTTSAWAGGHTSAGNPILRRSYQQIIDDSNSNSAHLFIQIKLHKIINPSTPDRKPINLNDYQIGEFLWEFLKLPFDSCLEIDNQTGRYNTCEILIKSGTDLTNILTSDTPHHFRDHKISASLISNTVSRITFKGVPIGVPDEEIVYLCSLYGKLTDGKVHREKVRLGGKERHTVISSTRYMEAQLFPGKPMKNYYWMVSPGHGEVGRRVLCLHPNQPKQCSWCFKYPPPPPAPPAS